MKLPDRMPKVQGSGSFHRGFQIAYDAIDKITDYLRSLQPRQGVGSRLRWGVDGVSRVPDATGTTTTVSGRKAARWA